MKMSEIRQKFPQYADVPDDQLLIALHKKFYSDMPSGQFFGSVERDTERERLQKDAAQQGGLLANVGAGMTTLGQGIKQRLGGDVTDADIHEKRALDEPLARNVKYGGAAQIAGQAAPLVAVPGAGVLGAAAGGALGGFLQPTTSDESVATNTALGGVAGGVVGKVFPMALGGLKSAGKTLYEGLAGPERVVRQMLQDAAGKGPEAVAAVKQYLAKMGLDPDAIPLTSAAAARSPDLAVQEIGARSARPADFVPGDQAHKAAVFKKTLDATKEAPNVNALRNTRRAEWESNWQTAMDVADPQVFAAEMPAFRANLDKALLSTESSNPAVRGVVNEIRSEMDRLGPNFTPGHLQQIRANLNARGHPMPQNAFQSAPRDSTAVNSLVDEMDNILNKTTSGAWDAVKGGYAESTKGVNAAKAAARVREKFVNEKGEPVIKAVDAAGEVPDITTQRMRTAIKGTRDKAGREMLEPGASAQLGDVVDALHAQDITQRVKTSATAGGGSATDPTAQARARFSRLPGGKAVQGIGDYLTDVPKREQLLANALRDPEILLRNLEQPTLTTKVGNFADDVLERTRLKRMADALRNSKLGTELPPWWEGAVPRSVAGEAAVYSNTGR